MNLIKETENRLKYQNQKLEDFKKCLESKLTQDARNYCYSEIIKTEKNIAYYSQLLNKLEGD